MAGCVIKRSLTLVLLLCLKATIAHAFEVSISAPSTVPEGQWISFSASTNSAPEGSYKFEWSQVSGDTTYIDSDGSTANIYFPTLTTNSLTFAEFEVKVTNHASESSSKTVRVDIERTHYVQLACNQTYKFDPLHPERNRNAPIWMTLAGVDPTLNPDGMRQREMVETDNLTGVGHASIDFNKDGHLDFIAHNRVALLTDEEDPWYDIYGNEYHDLQIFINQGDGTFLEDTSGKYWANTPARAKLVRKMVVADFNGDNQPDIFALSSGLDAEPHDGEDLIVILSSPSGYTWKPVTNDGTSWWSWHGGDAADIDNDGDVDLVLARYLTLELFINDGNGNFVHRQEETTKMNGDEAGDWLPKYTVTLSDVDEDGIADAILGGDEARDGDMGPQSARVLLGDGKGNFSKGRIILPFYTAQKGWGTSLDFASEDIDLDGDKDIIVLRTTDSTFKDDSGDFGGYYSGSVIEILYNDGRNSFQKSETVFRHTEPFSSNAWFAWLQVQDIDGDGDMDIFPDHKGYQNGAVWLNPYNDRDITPVVCPSNLQAQHLAENNLAISGSSCRPTTMLNSNLVGWGKTGLKNVSLDQAVDVICPIEREAFPTASIDNGQHTLKLTLTNESAALQVVKCSANATSIGERPIEHEVSARLRANSAHEVKIDLPLIEDSMALVSVQCRLPPETSISTLQSESTSY